MSQGTVVVTGYSGQPGDERWVRHVCCHRWGTLPVTVVIFRGHVVTGEPRAVGSFEALIAAMGGACAGVQKWDYCGHRPHAIISQARQFLCASAVACVPAAMHRSVAQLLLDGSARGRAEAGDLGHAQGEPCSGRAGDRK